MLPPVLEVFVVWHPDDEEGAEAAKQFLDHFHGTTFSGLIGGAIEVYMRSEGWNSPKDSPRPIPLPDQPPPNDVQQSQLTAIVPILGNGFAKAVEDGTSWLDYSETILAAEQRWKGRVLVLPLRVHQTVDDQTKLGRIFGPYLRIAEKDRLQPAEDSTSVRCRDLAQGILQLISPDTERLTIFISHTTWSAGEEDVAGLVAAVQALIAKTRLASFFDSRDLQPGQGWEGSLREHAAKGAMLAIRTDLYASREWCQNEMTTAKLNGIPVVIMDSLGMGEERGSFLLDHVARIPVQKNAGQWSEKQILQSLNLLVDECLKRALWRRQSTLAASRPELRITWWAPHAPELITLLAWMNEKKASNSLPPANEPIRVLHPDPPLGPAELVALKDALTFAAIPNELDIMTPRLLAARGG